MPVFSWLPGADKQSIAEREIANQDLNATRDGFDNRVGAWNWQDSFGAWLAGTTKEEILKLAQAKADEDLKTRLAPRATEAGKNLASLTARYQGVKGKTPEQLEAEISADERRGTALQTEIATNPYFKADTLSPTATAGDILGTGTRLKKAGLEEEKKDEKAERKAELERQELREEARNKRQELRQDRKDERSRLDRLQLQQQNNEYRRDSLNLEYARMARQDRQTAQDRKDKAIMMLVQGLGNLGMGFTA